MTDKELERHGRISKMINEEMDKRNLSQSELARQINVSQASINHYVQCMSTPCNYTLYKLTELFGLDFNDYVK